VSERTQDIGTFLAALTEEERRDTEHEAVVDPLEAVAGAVLDGRFRLKQRLGTGSTAVGLLVTDVTGDPEADLVLKVAVDNAAAHRLADEVEVLAALHHQRIVALAAPSPLVVGGRQALLLKSAGTQTLAQAMAERPRLSLDLLERYRRVRLSRSSAPAAWSCCACESWTTIGACRERVLADAYMGGDHLACS
jgi:hypothetical protein